MEVACYGVVVHYRDGRKYIVKIFPKISTDEQMKQESVQNFFSKLQELLFCQQVI